MCKDSQIDVDPKSEDVVKRFAPERDRYASRKVVENLLHPRRTLYAPGLRNGMSFADLGCGYGIFSIVAAKMIGKRRKVFAKGIYPVMLRIVRQRARSERLENTTTILRDVFTTKERRAALLTWTSC